MRIPLDPMVRFMRKVEVQPNGCHLWTGTTSGSTARYGYFNPTTSSRGKKVPAHRWRWEQEVGPIPEGAELDHVVERGCTSKLCVRLEHLEPVTHKENRKRSRLKVCRSGKHDLTVPENVRWDSNGHRRGCLLCPQEKAMISRNRKKAI